MKKYDAIVIGAGPGGYVAAIRLGKSGKKVLLVEKNKVGGVCLNIGCIPSKALISSSHIKTRLEEFTKLGIFEGESKVKFSEIINYKNKVTSKLEMGIGMLLKGAGVEIVKGEASFVSENSIKVNDEVIEFDNALIATGSIPIELPFLKFDHEKIIDSTDALSLSEVPKKMVVVGAGVVGMEMACFYSSMGAEVTVVEAMPNVFPMVDEELTAQFLRVMRRKKINILLSAKVKSRSEAGVLVDITDSTGNVKEMDIPADKVLIGVGRKPWTQNLNLDKAKIEIDSKGFIKTENLKTTNSKVFAIVDVIGNPLLAHKASFEALMAAKMISGGHSPKLNYDQIPSAIFTDPEMGVVGLTEKEAKSRGIDVITGKFPFAALGRAQAGSEIEGFVKVIAEKNLHNIEHSKIIGVHMIGSHTSDLISEGALAVKMGATLEDVADTIHSHPTFAEAMAEACESAMGKAIHVQK